MRRRSVTGEAARVVCCVATRARWVALGATAGRVSVPLCGAALQATAAKQRGPNPVRLARKAGHAIGRARGTVIVDAVRACTRAHAVLPIRARQYARASQSARSQCAVAVQKRRTRRWIFALAGGGTSALAARAVAGATATPGVGVAAGRAGGDAGRVVEQWPNRRRASRPPARVVDAAATVRAARPNTRLAVSVAGVADALRIGVRPCGAAEHAGARR